MIEVFAPRWRDRVALVAKYKVIPGINKIRFTKAGSYNGVYSIDGGVIARCPVDSNGTIECVTPCRLTNWNGWNKVKTPR